MSKSKIVLEGKMDLPQMIDHLERLLSAVKEGAICLHQGTESVRLVPAAIIDFEMEASQKKDKEKFSLKISWKKSEEYGVNAETIISSQSPKVQFT